MTNPYDEYHSTSLASFSGVPTIPNLGMFESALRMIVSPNSSAIAHSFFSILVPAPL